jgi:hypothetical protein
MLVSIESTSRLVASANYAYSDADIFDDLENLDRTQSVLSISNIYFKLFCNITGETLTYSTCHAADGKR